MVATKKQLDAVYAERNALWQALAATLYATGGRVGVRVSEIFKEPGSDVQWIPVIVPMEGREVGFHIPDTEFLPALRTLPVVTTEYDGADKTESMRRVHEFTEAMMARGPAPP